MEDVATLQLNNSNEFVPDFDSLAPKPDDLATNKVPKTRGRPPKKTTTVINPLAPRADNVSVDDHLKAILDKADKTELTNKLDSVDEEPKPAKKASAKSKKSESKQDKAADGKPIEVDSSKQDIDEQHQNLLLILHRYMINDRFSDFLKQHGFDLKKMNLQKKSIAELEELINRVRLTVNSKHENGFVDGLIEGAIQGSETLITKVSRGQLDLTGLKSELYQNEEFLDLVEQLKLEHLSFIKIDPKIRLAMIVMKTAMRVVAINKLANNMHLQQHQPVSAANDPSGEQQPSQQPQPLNPI